MKKTAHRPGQLVRSASRRGKQASKFHFDFTVERLFPGQKEGNMYYVKWTRGVKVAQTKSVLVEREYKGGNKTAGGMPFNSKMSLLVTLYRTDNRFDEKDAKLVLVSVSPGGTERTVAKMHFDLSQFAGVPNASAAKVFKLSEKASIKCTIDSRLVKSKGGKGSGGASSMMSGMTGLTDGEDVEDDFDDLDFANVDDVPDDMGMADEVLSGSSGPLSLRRKAGGGSGFMSGSNSAGGSQRKVPSVKRAISVGKEETTRNSGPSSFGRKSINGTEESAMAGLGSSAGKKSWGSSGTGSSIGGGGSDGAASLAEMKALQKEVAALKEEREILKMEVKRGLDKRKRIEAKHESEMIAMRASMSSGSNADGRAEAAERSVQQLTSDLDAVREERDKFRMEAGELKAVAKEVGSLREREKELGREVDRLMVGSVGGDAVVQERLQTLETEKETAEKKLQAHQVHSARVKDTYQKLSDMYNGVRDENMELQAKVDEMEASSGRLSAGGGGRGEVSEQELEEARQKVWDIEESKAALERDGQQMKGQLHTLQDRLDVSMNDVNRAREEADKLAAQLAEMTTQRDSLAAQNGGQNKSRADEKRLAEATKARESSERELARTRQKVVELEREVTEKAEDVEYERVEKQKAREERDALRESARALERRTSQVSQTADAVHSLKRQLSTHKMREADQSEMIRDLREEVDRVRDEKDALTRKMGVMPADPGNSREDGSVLEELVMTKLKLATAEDEMLQLEFKIRQQRKSEEAVQGRLAAHASSLEVKLGEANDELSRVRRLSSPSSVEA